MSDNELADLDWAEYEHILVNGRDLTDEETAKIGLFEKRERLKLERDQRQKSFVEKIRRLKEEFEEDERM